LQSKKSQKNLFTFNSKLDITALNWLTIKRLANGVAIPFLDYVNKDAEVSEGIIGQFQRAGPLGIEFIRIRHLLDVVQRSSRSRPNYPGPPK